MGCGNSGEEGSTEGVPFMGGKSNVTDKYQVTKQDRKEEAKHVLGMIYELLSSNWNRRSSQRLKNDIDKLLDTWKIR